MLSKLGKLDILLDIFVKILKTVDILENIFGKSEKKCMWSCWIIKAMPLGGREEIPPWETSSCKVV